MAITIIVEDGTGIEDANSYIDETFMSDYVDLQGSTIWCDNVSKQSLALVQATQFFDLRYSSRFCGELVSEDQGLLFPRLINGVNTGIPKQLKNAVAALAFKFLSEGTLDLNANSGAAISSQSVSVGNGAVSETINYFKESSKAAYSEFAITDRYVNQLMKNIGCESKGNSMFIEAYRG